MLVMSKRIDGSHRYLAVALEGPPAAQLAADHTITFSPSTATVAPVYPTIAAARAASGCATCKATTKPAHQSAPAPGEPARVPMRAPGPARGTQTRHLAQPTASDPALTAGDTALLPTPSVPTALCAVDNACGAATPVARNPGQCDNNIGLFSQTSNCTIDAQEISGVDAFRGFSDRVPGDTDTFKVHSDYQQQWDNGWRANAGPFGLNGHTSRQYGASFDITYALRGDCWTSNQPGDDTGLCDSTGTNDNMGQDSWRWEKHVLYECDLGGCGATPYEILFNDSFDGGNDQLYLHDVTSEGKDPAQITAGTWGRWARYQPDTSLETRLQSSTTVGNGAEVSINFPSSYGGATWSSNVVDQAYNNIGNAYHFRGPGSGLPWMGYYYDYDGNHSPWQYEYWSCEFAPGWIGATTQSQVFQGTTQCWENGY